LNEFPRLERLPPYVFNITGELKAAARRRGEDIIDFGMGNPDGPTPKHIVDKMIEAAQRPETHRYSLSKGIPRLRKAITNWYAQRYSIELDPATEAIVTIGSKEGIAHLCMATLDKGDVVLVPNPSYPIHIYGPVIIRFHRCIPSRRCSFSTSLPIQPRSVLRSASLSAWLRCVASTAFIWCTTSPTPT
jgi:alanine-synthesizing transaminase